MPDARAAPTRRRHRSSSTVDRLHRAAPQVARGLLTALLTCVPVAVLAGLVQSGFGPLHRLDESTIAAATDYSRARPGLLRALVVWQEVFLPLHVYALLVPPAAVWAWRRGLRSRALWGVATALLGWNLGLDVKLIVQRARPMVQDAVSNAPGYSFPSGHVFNVTMAGATVLVLVWPLLRSRAVRRTLVGVLAVAVVVTMADRVLLGVHYPSDTVAGVLLALALTYSSWAGFTHGRRADEPGGVRPGPLRVRWATAPVESTAQRPDALSRNPGTPTGFVQRWPAPEHSPGVGGVLRQLLRNAVLPGVLVWLLVVGLGLLVMGPLRELRVEEAWSRSIERDRDSLWNRMTDVWSTSTDTWFTIGTAALVSLLLLWLTWRWWVAMVPLLAITLESTIVVTATHLVGRPARRSRVPTRP